MIRLFEVNLSLGYSEKQIPRAIASALKVPAGDLQSWQMRRQAIDARKKSDVHFVCTFDVSVVDEEKLLRGSSPGRLIPSPDETYSIPVCGGERLKHRPIIIGSGPAGLFASLILAKSGYRPLLLERGKCVEERCIDVDRFWRDGFLNSESNVQFGEGGAGTFSDGKLTTLINDSRCKKVLEEFVSAGASASILTSYKPHIGTDLLRGIVQKIRKEIISLGGEVFFQSRVTGLKLKNGRIDAVVINDEEPISCDIAMCAIGHSARDTFAMLNEIGMRITPKAFSIGLRIEHPQRIIDTAQFGPSAGHPQLGAADYKLSFHAPNGRSVYTFCMCPGGEVIGAASHEGGLVTNGMSYSMRKGVNANSALLVNVTPADFSGDDALAGFRFQEEWEKRAWVLGGKNFFAPIQKVSDFRMGKNSEQEGRVQSTYRPGVVFADLHKTLPPYVCQTIVQAIPAFNARLRGFDLPDALLTGIETRSSSPVRLERGEDGQSSIGGFYPVGEGAGYAGGIMSAAVDGIKSAEKIIARYAPC